GRHRPHAYRNALSPSGPGHRVAAHSRCAASRPRRGAEGRAALRVRFGLHGEAPRVQRPAGLRLMARNKMAKDIWKRFRITPATRQKWGDGAPADLELFPDRDEAEKQSVKDGEIIDKLQDKLYAERKRALLVVLQGIDTAGKDGTIRHVF